MAKGIHFMDEMTSEISTEATPQQDAPQIPQKIKVKIDGAENEVDLEEIKRDYQKYRSSEKRFQEAAELRKQAQEESKLVAQFLDAAQKGDLSWLKGMVSEDQIRKFAEAELLNHIEWESKSEIEREAISAKREAEKLRKEIEEITQTRERESASKIQEQAYQEIEKDIVEAVKTLGYDYKVTPRFIRRIAEQMHASLLASEDPQSGPMPAKDAASRAFKGLQVDAQELLSVLPIEDVLQLLPQSVRKAIRQEDIKAVRSQAPIGSRQSTTGKQATSVKRKPVAMSTDEYFAKKFEKKFS